MKAGLHALLLFVNFWVCSSLHAQTTDLGHEERLVLERITVADGLPHNSVLSIIQDHLGFLWFATQNGLAKYDGYAFTIYVPTQDTLTSIRARVLRCIIEDQDGDLWIGSWAGGLYRFNRRTETFTRFRHDGTNPRSLSSNDILAVYQDYEKTLWIGTAGGGLNRFDRETQTFTHFRHDPNNPQSLSTDQEVTTLCEDRKGNFWVGTSWGINKLERKKGIFTRYSHEPGNPQSLIHNVITSIYQDRSGVFWIGTLGGLEKYNLESDSLIHYQHNPYKSSSLSSDAISSILETSGGELWIGTFNAGLNKYDPEKDRFIRYLSDPNDPASLSGNWIRSLFEDHSGVLWIGCWLTGLNKADPFSCKFMHLRHDATNANSLSSDWVWTLDEDRKGNLWIGTRAGGLVRFDATRRTFRTFRHNPQDLKSLSSDNVSYVYEDREGELWVGTYGGGLDRFVPTPSAMAGTFLHYKHNPGDSRTLSYDEVSTIFEDSNQALWVGTLGGGLNMIAAAQRKKSSPIFTHYHTENPQGIINDRINVIYEDASGTLWVGTDGAGLQRLNTSSGRFDCYYDAASGFDAILNILEDAAGRFWVGTYNGGLHLFDRGTGRREIFTEKEGLLHSSIKGILEDDSGNLWIGTEKGLSKFTYATKIFKNYDVSDGLQKGHFNFNAACKGRDGRMFFGGTNGVNIFHPAQLRHNDHPPQIVLTDFRVFNESVGSCDPGALDAPINIARRGLLSYSENDISIHFAALAFSRPGKNIYAYRLEGYDSEWRHIGAQRVATYTNLDPREYTFQVKAANSDGVWSPGEATLSITIAPPFWHTWWFRGTVLLAVVFSGFTLTKRRTSAIEKKRHLLELQVEERTEAARKIQASRAEVERLKNQLQAENVYLKDEIKLQHNFSQIITQNQSLINLLQSIEKVAQTDSTVLIYGETGTGKELFARAVHEISKRKDRPLIKVDCAALPPSLIESELFGHERGAFTGAVARRLGRFELANGGTMFLDEVGELPCELQPKLLRVIQEGEFNRVGDARSIKVDVRIIAATNRELQHEVDAGRFREDLFYRLNVFPLRIPPLRERKEDIPLLVEHFVQKFALKMGKSAQKIPLSVIQALERYDWPGNIRELENIIERAVILSRSDTLELFDSLKKESDIATSRDRNVNFRLEDVERQHIVAVLDSTHWRVSGEHGAAKILGLKPTTLASKMEKLGIRRPR